MNCWSSSRYSFPLPEGHRFPIAKYELLRRRVIDEGLIDESQLVEPQRASIDALRLVHTADYVQRFDEGRLTPAEQRRLGLPWSPALVERSYRAVGGTCEASLAALKDGIAMNLAGGTHHAFPSFGEGFCVFNDVAVAIRLAMQMHLVERVAVIDLDVHQGNGTHAIFAGDNSVFTFSMHGGRNFPFNKVAGSLDIELEDGTDDATYLSLLSEALPRVLSRAAPELVMYLAGADPHEGDLLGRLRLTFEGLAQRDAMVIGACRDAGIPVCITIAGGYGREIADTVQVHVNTVKAALS